MKTTKIWILMMVIFLSGGLIGDAQIAKADPLNACNNFYEGTIDCSSNIYDCHSCTLIGTTVTGIENAHWWCHSAFSDCNYGMLGGCTSPAAGVRHSFCGRYEGCVYSSGSCIGGTYTNADTLYEISCECSSPAACNPDGGVCSSENTVDATDCVACNGSGYQYSSGCNDLSVGCDINDGGSAFCECGGIFPPCWSICDDSPGGCCSNIGGICDASDHCVLPPSTAMVLEISMSSTDNPMMIGDVGKNVRFKVTKASDDSDVVGADVTIDSITCGTLPNPGLTNGSGIANSGFNAPAIASICTVTATAKKGGLDDATATYAISVLSGSCIDAAGSFKIMFDDDDYVEGDTVEASAFTEAGDPGGCVRLYYPSGTNQDTDFFDPGGIGNIGGVSEDSEIGEAGTWYAGLFFGACGSYATASCKVETIVTAPPVCTVTCAICAAAAPANASPSGGNCCGTGSCYACDAGYSWDGSNCVVGVVPPPGSTACNPNSWFFCNPLRGNIETLAEGGERIIGYILGLIGSVVLLLIIISGAMYMTSAGNEERIANSKKVLTAAVIGLGIALLAYSLLLVIMTVLGM